MPAGDPRSLPSFLSNELVLISLAINSALDGQHEESTAAPDKPRAGMVKFADGTQWNPGHGRGLYAYLDEWKFLAFVGPGGAVTQATSKSTAVTLSTDTGEITLNGAALNADTTVSFTLTNTKIRASDVLILNHVTTGTRGAYLLNAQCSDGSAVIYVRNITGGSLSEAIVIRFTRVTGAVA